MTTLFLVFTGEFMGTLHSEPEADFNQILETSLLQEALEVIMLPATFRQKCLLWPIFFLFSRLAILWVLYILNPCTYKSIYNPIFENISQ